MELTRKQVIEQLEALNRFIVPDKCLIVESEDTADCKKAIDYAINSLKTDEMYQLDYEGVQNIVVTEGMTNGEVIKQMFSKTPSGVRLDVYGDTGEMIFITDSKWWNSPYKENNNGSN